MKSWLIKCGKAWATVKHEGAFRGGKRLFFSFASLFRRVGSGDVLFIASGVGDSARYRSHHAAEALRFQGFKTAVTTQDNPFLSRSVERFSAFVFHRTAWTPFVANFCGILKDRKKTIIFDTDDLVFDALLFKQTAAYKAMNTLERRQYERGIGMEFLESPFVDAVTTSTSFLVDKLRPFGKPVFLVPNRLSEEDVKMAEEILQLREENRNRKLKAGNSGIVLGYFSGSTGHDRDFATIANVICDILRAHKEVRLFLAGPLTIPETLESYGDRLVRVPYVARAEHFKNLARVDVNIAPLEIGDPFCEAKSELKFFEAGLFGVPTVAAATEVFCEVVKDGIDGFVAKDEYEWREKLERLILDADFRIRMGEKARETALKKYTTRVSGNNTEYVNFLRERV